MGFVDIITILIPLYYLAWAILIIVAIVALSKVIRRYLKNGRLAEEKYKLENEEINKIKQRLTKMENISKDVE